VSGDVGADDPDPDMVFVPVAAGHVSVAAFDHESVLYDAVAARPVLLNVSAAAVWSMIDGVRTVAEIADVLADRFGADRGAVAADVARAVARFRELGLLQDESAPSTSIC